MKHIPKYLLPRITSVADAEIEEKPVGFVPFNKGKMNGKSRGHSKGGYRGSNSRLKGRRKSDPLKKFS
jgi:hypothetical protein